MTYQGKVIDAETLEPVEGAVVVAIWNKSRAGIAGSDTIFEDAEETLTNKKGDWVIIGPKGRSEAYDKNYHRIISFVFRKYYLQNPYFRIYKPGYMGIGEPGGFRAYPCVEREQGEEGVILIRRGDTQEEARAFNKKYLGFLPFVPLREPERRLRDLSFSFNYSENVEKLAGEELRRKGIRPYWVYTVDGIKKAKTREERLKSMHFSVGDKALPILDKMQREERERLIGPRREKAK
jgi:hypothetical protein